MGPTGSRLAASRAAAPLEVAGHATTVLGSATSLPFAQHDLLPRIGDNGRTPTAVVEDTVADAVAAREIARTDIAAAAAVILGIVLQTALFHLYGRLRGPLLPRAPALARAAVAAVEALA